MGDQALRSLLIIRIYWLVVAIKCKHCSTYSDETQPRCPTSPILFAPNNRIFRVYRTVSALHTNHQFGPLHRNLVRHFCLLITPLLLGFVISCDHREDTPDVSSTNRSGIDIDVDWTVLSDRKLLFKSDVDGDFDLYIADGNKRQVYRVTDLSLIHI